MIPIPILQELNDRLLLSSPELWRIRLHYIAPAAVAGFPLAYALPTAIVDPGASIPDPLVYFSLLLIASTCLSAYWTYLQLRQRQISVYQKGTRNWTLLLIYFACLLLINYFPFVFSWFMYEDIATTYRHLTAQDLENWRVYRERWIIEQAFGLMRYRDVFYPLLFALVLLIAMEVAMFVWLARSLPLVALVRGPSIVAMFCLSILIALATAGLPEEIVCLLWLGVYVVIVLAMILPLFTLTKPVLMNDAIAACAMSTPVIPAVFMIGMGESISDDEMVALLIVGIVVSVCISPSLQWLLNRSRAMPSE